MFHHIFVLLCLFCLKHFLADYPLQTPYMLKKFSSGWDFVLPLTAHSGVHALFTFAIAVGYQVYYSHPLPITVAVAALDFVIHFIMDRIKASPQLLGRFKPMSPDEFKSNAFYLKSSDRAVKAMAEKRIADNRYFWWALGFDQMVHALTDILVVYILVNQ